MTLVGWCVYYLLVDCFQLYREESNSSFLGPIIILMLAFYGSLLTHAIGVMNDCLRTIRNGYTKSVTFPLYVFFSFFLLFCFQ